MTAAPERHSDRPSHRAVCRPLSSYVAAIITPDRSTAFLLTGFLLIGNRPARG
jgi:hypothetical protein